MSTTFINTLVEGELVDARFEDGALTLFPAGTLERPEGEVLLGGWLTPPIAEPHCHLDAAFLGEQAPNRSGTLTEGIHNWAQLRPNLTAEDVIERATRCAKLYAANGCLRIRTHVDTSSRLAVEVLLALEQPFLELGIELQVVAFPQQGILRAPGLVEDWVWAVSRGCHAVGAIPHLERTTEEGWESVRMAFDLAEKYGRMVDLHCDESDDPGCRNLEVVCAQTLDRGMQGQVLAGHCTAMHSYPNPYAAKVIELVVDSKVQIVCNPLDNSVLQGRYDSYPRRRGLTRVDELWSAGASVAIGHDSTQDPWYALGRAHLVDAAYMLVHMGHLTSQEHLHRVLTTLFTENHQAFGGVEPLRSGRRGAVLWWSSADPIDLLSSREKPRVFRV